MLKWDKTIVRSERLINFKERRGKEVSKERFWEVVDKEGIDTIESMEAAQHKILKEKPIMYQCLYCHQYKDTVRQLTEHVGSTAHFGRDQTKRTKRMNCMGRRLSEFGGKNVATVPFDYEGPQMFPWSERWVHFGYRRTQKKKEIF